MICPRATFKDIPFRFIKTPRHKTMGEHEMHAEQWSRIFPVKFLDAIAPSMIPQSASVIFEMESETESLRRDDGKLRHGLTPFWPKNWRRRPALSTRAIEFHVGYG
jgi:hypothetical protein